MSTVGRLEGPETVMRRDLVMYRRALPNDTVDKANNAPRHSAYPALNNERDYLQDHSLASQLAVGLPLDCSRIC